MNLKDQFTIKVAESDLEKTAAYRLRYEVFFVEMKDERYADHETKEFRDSDDVEGSILFIALAGKDVIGTVRLKVLRYREFIGLEAYHLPTLAKLLNRDLVDLNMSIGCMDRGVVHPEYRGKKLIAALMQKGEEFAISLPIDILLSAREFNNTSAGKATSNLGYVEYAIGTHNETTCQCIYKVL